MVNDTISDLVNRLNNARSAGHDKVEVPFSKATLAVAKTLNVEGYVSTVAEKKKNKSIVIKLSDPKRKFEKMVRISKPGRRICSTSERIPRPKSGYGVAILSTSSGILSGEVARKKGIGGEIIFEVW